MPGSSWEPAKPRKRSTEKRRTFFIGEIEPLGSMSVGLRQLDGDRTTRNGEFGGAGLRRLRYSR
jgi:hypothetical protein